MKTCLVLVFLCLAILLVEGQSYYGPRRGGEGIRRRRCPPQACTLQHIPPECSRPNYFTYRGRRCRGCDIDICRSRGGRWNRVGRGDWNDRGDNWGDRW